MAKFFVIHGSIGLPGGLSAVVGDAVDLTPEQAAGPISYGNLADEKTYAGLKKLCEGAVDSGSVASLDARLKKLTEGLIANGKLEAAEPEPEAPTKKPEPKK